MPRKAAFFLAFLVVVSACSHAGATPTTTSTPSTTLPATTTTAAVTTTTVPTVEVAITNAPEGVTPLVEQVYLAAHTGASIGIPLPDGLANALSGLKPGMGELDVTGRAYTGTVLGSEIAVVVAGDDVILAVEDAEGWRIVGMKPASFGLPAFYGPEPKFLFVVGSDARPGEDPLRSRADSLHIVAMLPSTGQGSIVGIPRDSYVTTPDGLTDKFTSVLSRRGVDELLATAKDLSSIPLEGYVLTGFEGFIKLINWVGGLLLDVPFEMSDAASQAYFDPGEQHLDGIAALAFSRNRHLKGGDFTRSADQNLVMLAALQAVQALGIEKLPIQLEILTANAATNLDAEQLLTTAASAYELNISDIGNEVVEGVPETIDGAAVIILGDSASQTFEDLADGMLEPQP
jgi:polyisoprenyl-teichoic acid--peptidoglycan teichoic acid transferase